MMLTGLGLAPILAVDPITGLVGLFGTITTAFLGAMAWRTTKVGAESSATKAITDANVSLLHELRDQLALARVDLATEVAARRALEQEVRQVKDLLDDEQEYVEHLSRSLAAAGIPVPERPS